jgi:hypothetical protein
MSRSYLITVKGETGPPKSVSWRIIPVTGHKAKDWRPGEFWIAVDLRGVPITGPGESVDEVLRQAWPMMLDEAGLV